jgi:hypothetical protein
MLKADKISSIYSSQEINFNAFEMQKIIYLFSVTCKRDTLVILLHLIQFQTLCRIFHI